MRAPALATLLALALLAAGCAAPGGEGPTSGAATDDAWAFTDTDGATWTNATVEGTPTLLFFMATWCGTCRAKTPTLTDLHETYGDRVRFLSVGWDPTETDAELDAWKAERDQPWPHGVDATQDVSRSYNVRMQSWIVVLDANAAVVLNAYNPDEGAMRDALERALQRADEEVRGGTATKGG